MFIWALLILFSFSAAAQDNSKQELPDDFPQIRFRMNPLYNSTGFFLGRILNIRRVRPIASTYEGEIQAGFGTSPTPIVDRRCIQRFQRTHGAGNQQQVDQQAQHNCTLAENPFPFSTLNAQLLNTITQIKDQPALIFYTRHFWAPSHILTRTQNVASRAYPVMPNLNIERSYKIGAWKSLHPDAGFISGRIIRASKKSPVRETYEVIIQESENADNFRAMSVSDGGLFRYITRAMLTGKLLRIEYIRLWSWHSRFKSFTLNYRTGYRIISVELVEP